MATYNTCLNARCANGVRQTRSEGPSGRFPMEATILMSLVGFVNVTERPLEKRRSESERRFRLMANVAPVMIWMSGTDREFTIFNKPSIEFTGRSMNEELGEAWTEGVHVDDLERCIETYVTKFDQREPFHMEYKLRRYDGAYRWIDDSGVPLHKGLTVRSLATLGHA